MKNTLLATVILLAITATAAAQERRVYLMDRARAVQVFNAGNAIPGDFLLFTEGIDSRGKVAITIGNINDALQVRNAIVMALGIVFEQPAFAGCLQTHRGEECATDARSAKR